MRFPPWTAVLAVAAACAAPRVDVTRVDVTGRPATTGLPPVPTKRVRFYSSEREIESVYRVVAYLHYTAVNPREGQVQDTVRAKAAELGADGVVWGGGCGVVYGPFFAPNEHVDGFATAIRLHDPRSAGIMGRP